MAESELPDGSWSILPCQNEDAHLFSSNEHIKAISFTGSAAVGWKIKANAGKKRVLLELGGNAPVVVDETADLQRAADRITFGAFYSQGQSCISVQRVFVHEQVYDQLMPLLVQRAQALKRGDPMSEDVFLGPLITENDAVRLENWVKKAEMGGAKVLTGGKRDGSFFGMKCIPNLSNSLLDATIIEQVPANVELACQEAFG